MVQTQILMEFLLDSGCCDRNHMAVSVCVSVCEGGGGLLTLSWMFLHVALVLFASMFMFMTWRFWRCWDRLTS